MINYDKILLTWSMFGALNRIKYIRTRSLLVFSLGGEKTLLCTNSTRLVALVPAYVSSFAHQSRWLPTITRRKDRRDRRRQQVEEGLASRDVML